MSTKESRFLKITFSRKPAIILEDPVEIQQGDSYLKTITDRKM